MLLMLFTAAMTGLAMARDAATVVLGLLVARRRR